MSWIAFSPQLPSAITSLASTVGQGLSALSSALSALKVEIQVVQQEDPNSNSSTASSEDQAMQQVVQQISQQIQSLLASTGLYVLFVPLPKKSQVPIAASAVSGEVGSNYLAFPANALLAELGPAAGAALQGTTLYDQIMNPSQLFFGGNSGFVKTVFESLYDDGDPNRPMFKDSYNWAYAAIVAGAKDATQVSPFGTFLNRLLGGATAGAANAVPANRAIASLVAQAPRVGASQTGQGARLEWDLLAASRALGSYDNSSVTATEYAIIRSTDLRAMSATQVTDLFPGGTLNQGDTGQFGATVVSVQPYDGVTTSYEDPDVGSDITDDDERAHTSYYYHVAFRTSLRPQVGGDAQDHGYDRLSAPSILKLSSLTGTNVAARPGSLPDWVRTPSLVALFPPLKGLIDQVLEQLGSLAKGAQSAPTTANNYLAFLQDEINAFQAKASEISGFVSQLQGMIQVPTGKGSGLFCTVRSGKGAASTFAADLVTAFTDDSDSNRPQFDYGNEYVLGVILLAVGPDITAAEAALSTFFGPPAAANPVVAGVNAIAVNAAKVQQAAAAAAAPNLIPLGSDCAIPAPVPPTFDASFNPVKS